jgi:hypothetical protein
MLLTKSTYDLLIKRLDYYDIIFTQYFLLNESHKQLIEYIEVLELAMLYLSGEKEWD